MRADWCGTLLGHACRLAPLVAVLSWAGPAVAAKIACVGDSITYGYGLSNPSQQSYPALLQTLVGSQHTVRNFGTSGCTLLKKGDQPYWNDANFSASDAFKPDVVVVMLGTNDAKPQNWSHKADFTGDYNSMLDHYRALGALVYVAVPPPVYPPGAYSINPDVLSGEVVPLIRQIAASANAPLIDVFAALSGKASDFPDTVHPNAAGSQLIAQTVAAALQQGGFGGAVGSTGTGGSAGTGGSPTGTGGISGTGGASTGTGGSATGTGGLAGTGGSTTGTGGLAGTGGSATGTGGLAGTGGSTPAAGGSSTGAGGSSGGAGGFSAGSGGDLGSGGVSGTGGAVAHGGQSGGDGGAEGATGGARGGAAGASNAGFGGATGMGGGRVGSGGTTAEQTGRAGGCGCRLLGGGPLHGCAPLVVLLLAMARRRRRRADWLLRVPG